MQKLLAQSLVQKIIMQANNNAAKVYVYFFLLAVVNKCICNKLQNKI
jgi:hypothetical protein